MLAQPPVGTYPARGEGTSDPRGTPVVKAPSLMVEMRKSPVMEHDLNQAFSHGSPPRGPLCCREPGRDLVGGKAPVALQVSSGTACARVWRWEASLRAFSGQAPPSAHNPGGRGMRWEKGDGQGQLKEHSWTGVQRLRGRAGVLQQPGSVALGTSCPAWGLHIRPSLGPVLPPVLP